MFICKKKKKKIATFKYHDPDTFLRLKYAFSTNVWSNMKTIHNCIQVITSGN